MFSVCAPIAIQLTIPEKKWRLPNIQGILNIQIQLGWVNSIGLIQLLLWFQFNTHTFTLSYLFSFSTLGITREHQPSYLTT